MIDTITTWCVFALIVGATLSILAVMARFIYNVIFVFDDEDDDDDDTEAIA